MKNPPIYQVSQSTLFPLWKEMLLLWVNGQTEANHLFGTFKRHEISVRLSTRSWKTMSNSLRYQVSQPFPLWNKMLLSRMNGQTEAHRLFGAFKRHEISARLSTRSWKTMKNPPIYQVSTLSPLWKEMLLLWVNGQTEACRLFWNFKRHEISVRLSTRSWKTTRNSPRYQVSTSFPLWTKMLLLWMNGQTDTCRLFRTFKRHKISARSSTRSLKTMKNPPIYQVSTVYPIPPLKRNVAVVSERTNGNLLYLLNLQTTWN
jgi:hypothetical protein